MPFLETIFGRLADLILGGMMRRPVLRLLPGVKDSSLFVGIGASVSSTTYFDALIRIYNAGQQRVTVTGAGWRAKDGTILEAEVPDHATLNPGDPELVARLNVEKVLGLHDVNEGIVRLWVRIAGEDKRRERRLPRRDWAGELREAAARQTR